MRPTHIGESSNSGLTVKPTDRISGQLGFSSLLLSALLRKQAKEDFQPAHGRFAVDQVARIPSCTIYAVTLNPTGGIGAPPLFGWTGVPLFGICPKMAQ